MQFVRSHIATEETEYLGVMEVNGQLRVYAVVLYPAEMMEFYLSTQEEEQLLKLLTERKHERWKNSPEYQEYEALGREVLKEPTPENIKKYLEFWK